MARTKRPRTEDFILSDLQNMINDPNLFEKIMNWKQYDIIDILYCFVEHFNDENITKNILREMESRQIFDFIVKLIDQNNYQTLTKVIDMIDIYSLDQIFCNIKDDNESTLIHLISLELKSNWSEIIWKLISLESFYDVIFTKNLDGELPIRYFSILNDKLELLKTIFKNMNSDITNINNLRWSYYDILYLSLHANRFDYISSIFNKCKISKILASKNDVISNELYSDVRFYSNELKFNIYDLLINSDKFDYIFPIIVNLSEDKKIEFIDFIAKNMKIKLSNIKESILLNIRSFTIIYNKLDIFRTSFSLLMLHLVISNRYIDLLPFFYRVTVKFFPNFHEINKQYDYDFLSQAIKFADLNIVKYLVETCKLDPNEDKINSRHEVMGPTAISSAILAGRIDILKYLIRNGANPYPEMGHYFNSTSEQNGCYNAMVWFKAHYQKVTLSKKKKQNLTNSVTKVISEYEQSEKIFQLKFDKNIINFLISNKYSQNTWFDIWKKYNISFKGVLSLIEIFNKVSIQPDYNFINLYLNKSNIDLNKRKVLIVLYKIASLAVSLSYPHKKLHSDPLFKLNKTNSQFEFSTRGPLVLIAEFIGTDIRL